MNYIEALEKWRYKQCDGDWEHTYGVKINTLDNPGWKVVIDITETELADKHFSTIIEHRTENDWIDCEVSDNKFMGHGGPLNLGEILSIFINWINE